jgi:hypothetical protein
LSVRPSGCLSAFYQRGFHWTDFREISYWGFLRKSVRELEFWLKSDKHIGTSHEDLGTLFDIVDSSTKTF